MPRYIRDAASSTAIATAIDQIDNPERAVPNCRSEQESEPAVHGDRGGRVTRRVARVDRKVFEARDCRPVPMDDQCRDAVRRRLDAQDEDDESCDSPSAKEGAPERRDADDNREHDATGHDRADERKMRT